LVSTRDAERPGDCGSRVFMAEEYDGIGDKGLGDTTMIDLGTLLGAFLKDFHFSPFSSTAKVSEFLEYQNPD
jgi:hypothetical protein